MSRKATYKTFQEENGEVKIDLTVTQENDLFEVNEKIHNVHIQKLSSDELNMVLSELELPESVKLEIKKAVLQKQVGFLEDSKHRLEEFSNRAKEDADYAADNVEIEYNNFKESVQKELDEIEEKFKSFKDKL